MDVSSNMIQRQDSTGTTPSPTLFQTTTITSTTSATTTTEVIISAYDTTTTSLDIGMHANDSTSTPKFADVITATSHRTDKDLFNNFGKSIETTEFDESSLANGSRSITASDGSNINSSWFQNSSFKEVGTTDDGWMVPPFILAISGAAIFVLILVIALLGLLLRVNLKKKLAARREKERKNLPPYLDFKYPVNAFAPKPSFSKADLSDEGGFLTLDRKRTRKLNSSNGSKTSSLNNLSNSNSKLSRNSSNPTVYNSYTSSNFHLNNSFKPGEKQSSPIYDVPEKNDYSCPPPPPPHPDSNIVKLRRSDRMDNPLPKPIRQHRYSMINGEIRINPGTNQHFHASHSSFQPGRDVFFERQFQRQQNPIVMSAQRRHPPDGGVGGFGGDGAACSHLYPANPTFQPGWSSYGGDFSSQAGACPHVYPARWSRGLHVATLGRMRQPRSHLATLDRARLRSPGRPSSMYAFGINSDQNYQMYGQPTSYCIPKVEISRPPSYTSLASVVDQLATQQEITRDEIYESLRKLEEDELTNETPEIQEK